MHNFNWTNMYVFCPVKKKWEKAFAFCEVRFSALEKNKHKFAQIF